MALNPSTQARLELARPNPLGLKPQTSLNSKSLVNPSRKALEARQHLADALLVQRAGPWPRLHGLSL